MIRSVSRVDTAELPDRFARLPAAPRLLGALASDTEAYLVGGAVRDLLLGAAPLDLDVVLAGDRDLAGIVRRLGGREGAGGDRIHERFGTATVAATSDSPRIDLALARSERYPQPGALPLVAPAGIDADLRRRDFTVNALALAISGPRRGELLAVEHALEDLAGGRLRVLHGASFRDDPTRLLRLARYRARLGFAAEAQSAALAREAAGGGALDKVTGPRIGAELTLAGRERDPVAAYELMAQLGIDAAIAAGFGIADPSAARRAAALLPSEPAPATPSTAPGRTGGDAALAFALLGTPAAARRPLLERLGTDADTRRAVLAATREAPALAGAVAADGPPSQLLAQLPSDAPLTVALAAALAAPGVAQRLGRWLREWAHVGLAIGGDDLIASGVPGGPLVGAALDAALGAALDGRAPTREDQLAVALAVARGPGKGRPGRE